MTNNDELLRKLVAMRMMVLALLGMVILQSLLLATVNMNVFLSECHKSFAWHFSGGLVLALCCFVIAISLYGLHVFSVDDLGVEGVQQADDVETRISMKKNLKTKPMLKY